VRQGIDGLGIDEPAQGRVAVGDHAAVACLLPEVAQLQRVGGEVEELRRHADIVDVLEGTAADHEGTGDVDGGVVFAQHGGRRDEAAHDVEQRGARQVAVVGMDRQADAVDDGGEGVDQRRRGAARHPLRHVGAGQDHRHAGRLLVHVGFVPQAARAETVAVVGGVDDSCRWPGRFRSAPPSGA
jgi:hypothetical protein